MPASALKEVRITTSHRSLIVLALAHLAATRHELKTSCEDLARRLNAWQDFQEAIRAEPLFGREHVLNDAYSAAASGEKRLADTEPLRDN